MPYKDDADRFANRRLKRRVARIQRWGREEFDFLPANEYIKCRHCGKITRYNAPPKNRHWEDCSRARRIA